MYKYSAIHIFAYSNNLTVMSRKNAAIKKERFKNVAAKRVQKVLESMESLSKCANRNNYEYTDDDVTKLLKAIKEQMKLLEMSYTEKSISRAKTFSF